MYSLLSCRLLPGVNGQFAASTSCGRRGRGAVDMLR